MYKKILFLDDTETRHHVFRRTGIGADVTHVYNAVDAIKALDNTVFDVASLDHDLSEESIMTLPADGATDPRNWSGYDVALHIARMPADKRPKVVVIHSLNPPGRTRMQQALEGSVIVKIIPFRS